MPYSAATSEGHAAPTSATPTTTSATSASPRQVNIQANFMPEPDTPEMSDFMRKFHTIADVTFTPTNGMTFTISQSAPTGTMKTTPGGFRFHIGGGPQLPAAVDSPENTKEMRFLSSIMDDIVEKSTIAPSPAAATTTSSSSPSSAAAMTTSSSDVAPMATMTSSPDVAPMATMTSSSDVAPMATMTSSSDASSMVATTTPHPDVESSPTTTPHPDAPMATMPSSSSASSAATMTSSSSSRIPTDPTTTTPPASPSKSPFDDPIFGPDDRLPGDHIIDDIPPVGAPTDSAVPSKSSIPTDPSGTPPASTPKGLFSDPFVPHDRYIHHDNIDDFPPVVPTDFVVPPKSSIPKDPSGTPPASTPTDFLDDLTLDPHINYDPEVISPKFHVPSKPSNPTNPSGTPKSSIPTDAPSTTAPPLARRG
ncbi:uncharacterized protein RCC_01009 [Ramularia collo-cygni]|uniref:Uncharacterized protein n=1 Tax=Ramularia collo-cygni TaxID=112498 RepID=A0A2D3UMC6_9PEZI|nr:uncharacterized protein RCC_01009 [Ramularia collo-cygni]CZT15111.1 uncharacterized protein RCC_01009 [Ramularia collo-cygni]